MSTPHGGDLTGIGRAFGREPDSLLDFSANINPLGPPEAVSALLRAAAERPAMLTAYPDPHARELVAALGERVTAAAECIVVANGNAALLDASVRALGTRRCVVPVPAFNEYARALAATGAEMIPLPLEAQTGFALDAEQTLALARATGADTCILSNPHNPSGRGEAARTVTTLAAALARLSCATIVDEAFVDYAPDLSVLVPPGVLGERTIVLRSVTKFFAIPAMRVGYCVAPSALAERIRAQLPAWPVGTLDQQAASAVLADARYARKTLAENAFARSELLRDLEAIGVRTFAPAANFVFCDVSALTANVTKLRAGLIRESGIVIRTFEDDAALRGAAYVRVAVRLPQENARLTGALSAYATTVKREEVGL